jgi:toxin ParE1/3/4
MQVKWLKTALDNLDQEAEYIASSDPEAAKRLVATVFASVDNLKTNPSLGRPGRVIGTRELIVPGTRYLVPYRVSSEHNRVEVLRVFHTARQTPKSW